MGGSSFGGQRVAVGSARELDVTQNGHANGSHRSAATRLHERFNEVSRRAAFRRRRSLVVRLLATSDAASLTAAFALASPLGAAASFADARGLFVLAAALPIWLLLAKLHGLYATEVQRAAHSGVDEVVTLVQFVTVGVWVAFGLSWMAGVHEISLGRVFVFWALAISLMITLRAAARFLARRHVAYLQNTIVVGAGDVGQLVAAKLMKHPEYGINVVGFVDDTPKDLRHDIEHVALLGSPADLDEVVGLLDVERVVIAFSNDNDAQTVALARRMRELDVQVDIVPRLYELMGERTAIHAAEGLPLVSLLTPGLPPCAPAIKRVVDLTLSVGGLLLLAPAFALISLLIKLDSPGPIFFRQVRMGHRDRPFEIYKFRTMTSDADARKSEVAHLNIHARNGGDPRMFKVPNDPRVTRLGAFLRRYSLDELPQLINVVRGEMSLVGPRPLILEEDSCITEWGRRRLRVKPGVTGLWQVLGSSDIPFDEMVRLDYLYVTNWSFLGDLRLIAQTIPALLRTRAAY